MDEIKYCDRCGAKLTGRWENLSPGLVATLIRFADKVKEKEDNAIHLQNDLSLTKNQYNNFQKLRYFGLVAKVKDPAKRKSGYWALTRKAGDFLTGTSIPKSVFVFRNRIGKAGDELVDIARISGNYPYWLQAEDFDYENADSASLPHFSDEGQGELF